MLDRYGYEHTFQNPEVRKKAKESFEKYRQEHPGYNQAVIKERAKNYKEMMQILQNNPDKTIDDFRKIPEYEEQVKAYDKSIEIINKIYQKQKENGTLNTSRSEEDLFNILTGAFDNVKRNYKDKRYNYKCDFYIPRLDLFIEYQGSMFHNGKPYSEIYKDELDYIIERNKFLKERTGKSITRYDNLIKTWTISDVNKRNTAKVNKLNYLEIYPVFNIDNIIDFINTHYDEYTTDLQIILGDEQK